MKKLFYLLGLLVTVAVVITACQKSTLNDSTAIAEDALKAKPECTTIQSGELMYTAAGHYLEGEPMTTGYDIFGYNYQAHMFNGDYANIYLGRDGFPPYEGDDEAYLAENPDAENHWAWVYRGTNVIMKWNDAWISNKDCDDDGVLDRDLGQGGGAWLTNHMEGGEGQDHWTYFVKIIAPPLNAYKDAGFWYTEDGTEIGPAIWGSFAIILEVESGTGPTYISEDHAGFGGW